MVMKTKVLLLFVIMFIQMILGAQDNKWFQKGIDAKKCSQDYDGAISDYRKYF